MLNSQAADYDELRAMVASIVAEMLGGGGSSTWVGRRSQVLPRLYSQPYSPEEPSGADRFFGAVGGLYSWSRLLRESGLAEKWNVKNAEYWSKSLGGLTGIYSAYKSGDPIGGAMSGYQLGTALGPTSTGEAGLLGKSAGLIGLGIGLLAGLFGGGGQEIDRWDRPKFKKADKAYDKLFTVDRGEEDEFYLPDSFYFRTGWTGSRNITVRIGNDQFVDFISDATATSYDMQLQQGLVPTRV